MPPNPKTKQVQGLTQAVVLEQVPLPARASWLSASDFASPLPCPRAVWDVPTGPAAPPATAQPGKPGKANGTDNGAQAIRQKT